MSQRAAGLKWKFAFSPGRPLFECPVRCSLRSGVYTQFAIRYRHLVIEKDRLGMSRDWSTGTCGEGFAARIESRKRNRPPDSIQAADLRYGSSVCALGENPLDRNKSAVPEAVSSLAFQRNLQRLGVMLPLGILNSART